MHKNIIIPLLYQYGLFIRTRVPKNVIVPKDAIFYLTDITWYAEAAIYKKSSFLSFHSLLFLVSNTGEVKVKLTQMWHRRMCWKMPLCKWHTFWKVPWLICCFLIILFYAERKSFLMRNLASLTLEVQIAWKISEFRCYWWKYQMLKYSWISESFS